MVPNWDNWLIFGNNKFPSQQIGIGVKAGLLPIKPYKYVQNILALPKHAYTVPGHRSNKR